MGYFENTVFQIKKCYPILNADEQMTLIKKYKESPTVGLRDQILYSNIGLILKCIQTNYSQCDDYMKQDLFNEGIIGMMKALEKFDISMNVKFSTYAFWWVRQSIQRYFVDTNRIIRIPAHLEGKIQKVKRFSRTFLMENNRIPTANEIAQNMNYSLEEVENMLSVINTTITSINQVIGDNEDTELGELIDDPDTDTEREVLSHEISKSVQGIIEQKLNKREYQILILRYGLEGNRIHTLDEVGKKLNLSRERVRQIEIRAMRKLSRCVQLRLL